jgi:hypothetical protein
MLNGLTGSIQLERNSHFFDPLKILSKCVTTIPKIAVSFPIIF